MGEAGSEDDLLAAEYMAWRKECAPVSDLISLQEVSQDEDGVRSMVFAIDSRKFQLRCPGNYPHYEDDNFFVEAPSSLQLWCNALNEYLLDSSDSLRLAAILSKGCSLYSSKDRKVESMDYEDDENSDEENMEEEDSDDNIDGDFDEPQVDHQLDDLLEQDLNWELEISRRKKRWKAKEDELREAKEQKESTLHQESNLKTHQPKQIFTKAAASGILINDLVSIMESSKDTKLEVDTVGDNIYVWNVKMSNFGKESPLDAECAQLLKQFGYNFIELQMEFSMDLYPFYPPLVKVIRPRLQGAMMLRVTTMEILKLTFWDPARDMKTVLLDIKTFLAAKARLDLNSVRNDKEKYPDGAYIDIEHHLLRLALVSEITPRVNKKYGDVTFKTPGPSKPESEPRKVNKAFDSVEEDGKCDHDDNNDVFMFQDLEDVNIESDTSEDDEEEGNNDDIMDIPLPQDDPEDEGDEEIKLSDIPLPSNFSEKSKPSGSGLPPLLPIQVPSPASSGAGVNTGHENHSLQKLKKLFKKKAKKSIVLGGTAKKTLAKGTGYSSYHHKGWDVKAWQAAQREKDKQIMMVLEKILEELKKFHRMTTVKTRNLPDLLFEAAGSGAGGSGLPSVEAVEDGEESSRGGKRKRKHSPDSAPHDPISDLYAVLESSALVPFLESRLQHSSFLEICRHTAVFKVIIGILREMSDQSSLVSLLGPLPDQQTSLHSLLQSLECQARIVHEKVGKASANGSVPCKDKSETASKKADSETKDGAMPSKKKSKDEGQGLIIAREFLQLSKAVTEALKSTGYLPDINGIASGSRTETPSPVSSSGSPEPGPSPGASLDTVMGEEERYVAVMQPLQYDSLEFASQGHAFLPDFTAAQTPSSQTIFRIAQELSSLAAPASLPCSLSSCVLVRSDDSKIPLIKAVITGPSETPYTGGVFEFDIYFPNGYPKSPPKVKFRTTGAGSVRFNPNLYNEGKVCLSLLGTWGGAKGEEWNADNSTIIQVLVSIQSLILVPEPYYNEPGFEKNYGTAGGNRESQSYNEGVFKNNLKHAILGQIRAPPEGFSLVTRSHFFHKRESLIKELESQAATYKSKEIQKLLAEVKSELLKLENPDTVKTGSAESPSQPKAGAGGS